MALYCVLGIAHDATKEEVRSAYKRQALTAHPDKGGCKETFHAVTRAFETLYDDAARGCYDSRLAKRAEKAARSRCTGPNCGTNADEPLPSKRCPGASATGQRAPEPPAGPQAAAPGGSPVGGSRHAQGRARAPAAAGPRARAAPSAAEEPEGRRDQICEQLRALLQCLGPAARRSVLEGAFTQAQRRALEQWMTRRGAEGGQAAEAPSEAALIVADVASSSGDSSSSEGASGDEVDGPVLALEEVRSRYDTTSGHTEVPSCRPTALGRATVHEERLAGRRCAASTAGS
ncbi:unnamed protein product [Prorocentrum cordatum]|uniref:J domain-containing protein n=1 Tax=Prorocentrum cordatum TaxID=2364126 RepID=A0ABN9R6L1_9DINO|nr:unnamed protein product [Polarella glacialis]